MENMEKGLSACTKMVADKSAENTPYAQKFICPNRLPKPKSLGFAEKRLHWDSVVRGFVHCEWRWG